MEFDREALATALRRMEDHPVLLLEGPRSVGKSTLLRNIAGQVGGRLLDLDDPATRDAIRADPAFQIAGVRPVLVDEYQKAPEVLDAVKAVLNQATAPGMFVITGSARHDALPPAAQALTGRLTLLTLPPLSQAEMRVTDSRFLARLLSGDDPGGCRGRVGATTRDEYIAAIVRGGFPLAVAATTPAARNRWIDDYIKLSLERDIRELRQVRKPKRLRAVLDAAAGQTAQLFVVSTIAEKTGIDWETADNYVTLLERIFLLYRLEAWGITLSSRVRRTPKIHMMDSGISARMLRLTPARLADRDPTAQTEFGQLLKTFLVGELLKQSYDLDNIISYGHWRNRTMDEVDLVVERDDGRVIGMEIKAGGRVRSEDLKGLRQLRAAVGPAFLSGIVFYLGTTSYSMETDLHVVPADSIWA